MLVIHDVNSFICQTVHVSICVKWRLTMEMVKKWFYMKYDPYFCVLSSLSILIYVICQLNVTSDLNWTNGIWMIFVFVLFFPYFTIDFWSCVICYFNQFPSGQTWSQRTGQNVFICKCHVLCAAAPSIT